jgi:hypothetical protein
MQLRKNRIFCLARAVLLDNGVDSPWVGPNTGALLTWLLNHILNSAGILRGDSRFNRRMANREWTS